MRVCGDGYLQYDSRMPGFTQFSVLSTGILYETFTISEKESIKFFFLFSKSILKNKKSTRRHMVKRHFGVSGEFVLILIILIQYEEREGWSLDVYSYRQT